MSSASRYSTGAIAFHWIIATLIVLNFIAVWVAERVPKPEHMQIMNNHKAFGLTILALSVISVLWRLFNPGPPYVATLKPWEAALARVVHTLFWFLVIAMPLTGWGMVSAGSGQPVSWFGLFSVPPLPVPSGRGPGRHVSRRSREARLGHADPGCAARRRRAQAPVARSRRHARPDDPVAAPRLSTAAKAPALAYRGVGIHSCQKMS